MTTKTVRLTMAQALTRFLANQMTEIDGKALPIFGGVWAIFGHGNVAGLGEALYGERERLPTFRAHNEQGMAHAAIAYAKANFRRRFMAVTTSVGPGATNLVTAAALAHVNRLPVLLLPGDVFANRRPDPVLQQVEAFGDGTVSANDCFRPVSRYFDRITRPEQLIPALARTMAVLTDPAECGPVTLGLCQDVQAEAFNYPESFFEPRVWRIRRPRADEAELASAADLLRASTRPVIVAGGGVLYSGAMDALKDFAQKHGVPVLETQAGKSAMAYDDLYSMGSVGVTGTSASNSLAQEADLVLAVGTRLQDFTTGSWSLFANPERKIVGLNVQPFDAAKHAAQSLVCDAAAGLAELSKLLAGWRSGEAWTELARAGKAEWMESASAAKRAHNRELPSDGEIIGAVERAFGHGATVVCAAGGLPGELHKLWEPSVPGGYHLEYGFSCMGYEIAGGLGVKIAKPDAEVVVMVGDGSYLMLNSELATSIMLGMRLTVVVLDNKGYGCINRLQRSTGSAGFNNLWEDSHHEVMPSIDFVAHARALGCIAGKASGIGELEDALRRAKGNDRTTVVVIDTDPYVTTEAGGHWWDVAVPEVSTRPGVREARASYEAKLQLQRLGD